MYITNLSGVALGLDGVIEIASNAVDFKVDDTPDLAARAAKLQKKGLIDIRGEDYIDVVASEALTAGNIVNVFDSAVASVSRAKASGVATVVTAAHTFSVGDVVKITGFTDTTFNKAAATILSAADATHITYACAGDDVNSGADTGATIVPVKRNIKTRKANATAAGKEASGFVKADVAAKSVARVYTEGENDKLSALVPGTFYHLSATGGAVVATAPSTAGNVVQVVGQALTDKILNFEADKGSVVGG